MPLRVSLLSSLSLRLRCCARGGAVVHGVVLHVRVLLLLLLRKVMLLVVMLLVLLLLVHRLMPTVLPLVIEYTAQDPRNVLAAEG